jgi:hypothetical protein
VEEVIRRHGALRTQIVLVGGNPRQRIKEPAEYDLEVLLLPDEPGVESEARARGAVTEALNRRMDVDAESLFNVRLLKVSEDLHLLTVSIHHLITDGFSQALLFRELWLLYEEFSRGRESPLQKVPAQYAAYSAWQHETRQAWLDAHESYWEARLSGATRIQFPVTADIPGSPDEGFGARRVSFGETLSAGARELAVKAKTLLPLVMVAVYAAAILKRWRQFDFVVPFNVSGRHLPMHETMVGYLAYILYLRIELTGEESGFEIIGKVSREFFKSLEHQDFGRKVADIQIERFRFEFQGHPPSLADFGIQFSESADGISADLGYRTALFTAASAEEFARDMKVSLERFVRSPESKVV